MPWFVPWFVPELVAERSTSGHSLAGPNELIPAQCPFVRHCLLG